ncbi:MAG: tetratricopeptide repeat protein [Anaerolineae bacterium]
MIEIPVSYGEWVQSRRKQLDLTRNALAVLVGCSPVTIKKIERDERRPSRQIAELLATHLEIEPERMEAFIQKARGHFVEEKAESVAAPSISGSVASAEQEKPAAANLPPVRPHSHGVLPDQSGPFIGRQPEISHLLEILEDPTQRLITIIGTGGMGKSRLATHVGHKLIDSGGRGFSNGIFYIDFNAHKDPSHLVPAVAKAVGLSIKKERRLPKDQLFDWLRPKKTLLIFDNFDHLIDEAAFIAELLETSPGLKIMVTSRERLNLQGEQIFPLQGLAFPQNTEQFDRKSYPAVDLFLEHAHRVQPEFALTDENLEPIVKLCRIVEGMPLSIELAAAWIDLLPPAEIVSEIENSLDFLETNIRNFPERHRSMRAVFDASWEKLGNNEKKTFARLTVFQGMFSRRAARSVAGTALSVLGRLVDRSLVRYDSNLEIYHINELLRQYGTDHLEALESAEARLDLFERHSLYYLEAIAERTQQMKGSSGEGSGQTVAMEEIGRDFKNVRYAWRWAVENQKLEFIALGIEPLGNFLEFKGRYHEGEETFLHFTQTLKKYADEPEKKRPLLDGYSWLNVFQFARGKVEESQKSLDMAAALIDELSAAGLSIDKERAFVLALTGQLKSTNSLEEARPYYLQALDLFKSLDMGWEQAAIMSTLGSRAKQLSDYEEASKLFDESLKIRQQIGDQIGAAETMASISELCRFRGLFFEAVNMAQHSVDLARQINNDNVLALGLGNLGMAYMYTGDFAKQHRYLIESLALYTTLENTNRLPDAYFKLCLANASLGQYDEATSNAQRGLSYARQTGNMMQIGRLLYVQGLTSLAAGYFDSAKQILENSLATFPDNGRKNHFRNDLQALIGVADYSIGNPTPAKRQLYSALKSAMDMGDPISLLLIFGIAARFLADADLIKEATVLGKIAERFSPPYQNAAWLKSIYGDRLAELEPKFTSEEEAEIEEYLKRHSLWDEANALLAFMEKGNWGRVRPAASS